MFGRKSKREKQNNKAGVNDKVPHSIAGPNTLLNLASFQLRRKESLFVTQVRVILKDKSANIREFLNPAIFILKCNFPTHLFRNCTQVILIRFNRNAQFHFI